MLSLSRAHPFQRCCIAGDHTTLKWCIENYGQYILPEIQGTELNNCKLSWPLAAVFEGRGGAAPLVTAEHEGETSHGARGKGRRTAEAEAARTGRGWLAAALVVVAAVAAALSHGLLGSPSAS